MGNPRLGVGVSWRPELAVAIERRLGLGFVEVLAEDLDPAAPLPEPLGRLRERGLPLIPHGVSLSLGGADPPDAGRLRRLARIAEASSAPLVSEHLAFVRAGGCESGHLLPLPRTEAMLEIVVENVMAAQAALPVPLALENIASPVDWPGNRWEECEFLCRLLDRTGALLLLDLSNLYANAVNRGSDPAALLERLPLDRLAYVHVGGGRFQDGVYQDTHTDPVPGAVFELVEKLWACAEPPGALLERDDSFPPVAELYAELDALSGAMAAGSRRRKTAAT